MMDEGRMVLRQKGEGGRQKAEGGKTGDGRPKMRKAEGRRQKEESPEMRDQRPKIKSITLLSSYFLLLTFYFLLFPSAFVFIHFQNPLYKNIPAIFLFFFLHVFNKDPSPVVPKKIHDGS